MPPSSSLARFGPWAVVAGASEGLGAAFAQKLAAHGLSLVLIARREGPLKELALSLTSNYGIEVTCLPLDLATEEAASIIADVTASLDVGLVVYNAAASQLAEFTDCHQTALDSIIAVNCAGLVRVVRRLVPRLIGRCAHPAAAASTASGGETARARDAGLILMSSMSGFRGHACAAVYAASKAFTTSLGEGLWAELEPQGVSVRVCAAGAIATPNFLSVTPERTRSLALPMDAASVAQITLASLERDGRRGALVVPGWLNLLAAFIMQRLLWSAAAVAFMSSNLRRIYSMPARSRARRQ